MATIKTHRTAVVVIPPESVAGPVQAIRHRYDRQVRRWMPHITLLYPFVPREAFDAVEPRLAEAARRIAPFEVTLTDFRWFHHGGQSYTLWLQPEPAGALIHLHSALREAVPHCDDTARYRGGYTPHLSVGQVRGPERLEAVAGSLRAQWRPLRFLVDRVYLIWRNAPPDDVFRIDRSVVLGT